MLVLCIEKFKIQNLGLLKCINHHRTLRLWIDEKNTRGSQFSWLTSMFYDLSDVQLHSMQFWLVIKILYNGKWWKNAQCDRWCEELMRLIDNMCNYDVNWSHSNCSRSRNWTTRNGCSVWVWVQRSCEGRKSSLVKFMRSFLVKNVFVFICDCSEFLLMLHHKKKLIDAAREKKIMNLWLQTTSKSSNEGVKCRTHEIFNFLIPHFHTLLPSRRCWRFFVAISAHFTRLECNFVLIQAFSDARCMQSESSRQKTSNPVEFTPKTVF